MNTLDDADFSNISSPRFFSRFLSVVIDVFAISVITLFFSFVSIFAFNNSTYYQDSSSYMKNEARVCYKMSEESHLITYNGKGTEDEHYTSKVDQNEIFKKTLQSHILLSFNNDNSYFVSKGITTLNIDSSIKPADFDVDEIAYFYYEFVRNKNSDYQLLDLSSKSYQQYHYDLFKSCEAKVDNNSLWLFEQVGDFPILKSEAAYKTYMFLKSDQKTSEFEITYNSLNTQYVEMWNSEYGVLTSSQTYKTHYDNYQNKYRENAGYIDLFLVLSFVISFVICYLLPTLISKLSRTLGKRVEYIYIVSNQDTKASKKQIVSRALLKIFPYFGFSFIPNLIVGLFNSSWSYKVFYIGSWGISLSTFNTIFIVLAVISLMFVIIDEKKRCIADFICRTRLIDYQEFKDKLCPTPSVDDKTKIDKKESFETIDSNSLEKSRK